MTHRRRFTGPMTAVNVKVTPNAKAMLDRLAGRKSLGYAIERLIEDEYKRWMDELTLHQGEKAIKRAPMVQ